MADIEKVAKVLEDALHAKENYPWAKAEMSFEFIEMLLELLKEQEKKQITLHKKHVITWGRNDEFSTRKLYEAICETLLDEGELIIARTDDHEKVDFVFYVSVD